jgi:hypothetical protein
MTKSQRRCQVVDVLKELFTSQNALGLSCFDDDKLEPIERLADLLLGAPERQLTACEGYVNIWEDGVIRKTVLLPEISRVLPAASGRRALDVTLRSETLRDVDSVSMFPLGAPNV